MDNRDQERQRMDRNGGSRDDGVAPLPGEVMEAVVQDIEDAGGAYEEAPEYEGSVGRTMFDTPYSEDGTVTALMSKENIEDVPRQSLVRIKSVDDGRSYLGAVVKGPFAEPDGLRADSPILVSVTVRGIVLQPKHHGRVQVEIIGEELDDGAVVPPRRRPLPNSPVFVLDGDETARSGHRWKREARSGGRPRGHRGARPSRQQDGLPSARRHTRYHRRRQIHNRLWPGSAAPEGWHGGGALRHRGRIHGHQRAHG